MVDVMPKRLTLHAGLIAALVAGTVTLSAPPAVAAPGDEPTVSAAQVGGFDFARPEVVASGLATPWGLGFLPDGSALVTERNSARVLQLRPGQAPQALGTVPGVVAGGEGGLLGLAVSPTYAQDQYVYVYFSAANDNRITRFRLNAIGTQQVVLSGIPKSSIHNGGRIAFGPDGNLYAGVGDANVTSNAQNTGSLAGKILRMTPTGGVPAGNPFNNFTWSYGHRNVQGLAWDAQGRLFATEFGQNTWDEVNLIVAGGNYGWPTAEGTGTNPAFRNPIVTWSTAVASPSGAAIANGYLFAAALRGTRLWAVPLDGGTPVSELQGTYGRLRTVAVGPDGYLWVTTSNRDGRGTPAASDDRVLRFPPTGTGPQPGTVYSDTFETATGWTGNPNGTDTATAGRFERGDPAQTTSGVTLQPGTTPSGSNALVTGASAGAAAGDNDVDGGTTSIQSPAIALPSGTRLTLSFAWYLAHLNNAATADHLRVSVVGTSTSVVFTQTGAASNRAGAWATATADVSGFAGQSVRIRVEAADAGTASLVEAGVDDVRITSG
jgi:glucose/arabinose dehydrogenase